MKPLLLAALLAIFVLLPTTSMADAPAQCGPHDIVAKTLGDLYGERVSMMGLSSDNTVIELYSSVAHATWTLVITIPTGISCLSGSGTNFETVKEKIILPGQPS